MGRLLGQIFLASTLALLGACSNDGIAPPRDQFFYPIAGAIDGTGRWLYVVNSDFDLRYNGGTVVAVDLQLVRAAIDATPGRACDPTPVDERAFIPRPEQTVTLSPFAVDVAWARYDSASRTRCLRRTQPGAPAPSGDEVSRLYVAVRGDSTLTWMDATPDGALRCGDRDEVGRCAERYRVGGLPPDPSGISLDADCGYLTVVHQNTDSTLARATLFHDTAADESGQNQGLTLLNTVPGLPSGLSSLAYVTAVGDRPTWVSVSRAEASYTVLQVFPGSASRGETPFLYRSSVAPVQGLNSGANNRAIALDPANPRRAFVASRSPEALLTVDLSDLYNPVVTDVTPVCAGPSRLAPVVDPETGHTRVYVVCFDARQVFVVDPDEHRLVGQFVTRRGPHTILADGKSTGRPTEFLYVLDFIDSTIEVIDVRPTVAGAANPTRFCRVMTLGVPSPPEANR